MNSLAAQAVQTRTALLLSLEMRSPAPHVG
jgi:hypothetical protein